MASNLNKIKELNFLPSGLVRGEEENGTGVLSDVKNIGSTVLRISS